MTCPIQDHAGGIKWPDIGAELTAWADNANSLNAHIDSGDLAPRDLATELARIHNAFERIHPFIDGNGRTGRLALNLVLVRLGFPPAISVERDRDRYLTALDQADKGDHGRLAEHYAKRRAADDSTHTKAPTEPGDQAATPSNSTKPNATAARPKVQMKLPPM